LWGHCYHYAPCVAAVACDCGLAWRCCCCDGEGADATSNVLAMPASGPHLHGMGTLQGCPSIDPWLCPCARARCCPLWLRDPGLSGSTCSRALAAAPRQPTQVNTMKQWCRARLTESAGPCALALQLAHTVPHSRGDSQPGTWLASRPGHGWTR
jgi:hypothetical protein